MKNCKYYQLCGSDENCANCKGYQAAPETQNIKAAKQALKEILNQNTLEVLQNEKLH